MLRPMFSVVIPTKERAETLRACLRTCLDQDFAAYEVVVCDNHSSPATRDVVESFNSSRVQYLRTERPLAMSANWERAVAAARGEYVTVLGDDDGLMPYALRELARLVQEYDRPRAIRWERGIYTWPNIAVRQDANYLLLPISRGIRWRSSPDLIREVIAFKQSADHLPMIYNSIVHRSLIDEHRQRAGCVFPAINPDIYSAFAFGWLAGTFLSVDVPMNIAGLSGHSTGVAGLQLPPGSPVITNFDRLNAEFNYIPHPRVPYLPTPPIHVVDSFEYAKQIFFPNDDELSYDRRAMTEHYLSTISSRDADTRARYRSQIRAALTDEPELLTWFDREAPDPPPSQQYRLKPRRRLLGLNGLFLRLDTSRTSVSTIADAVNAAASILGYGGSPIEYDKSSSPYTLASWAQASGIEREKLRNQNLELRQRLRQVQRSGILKKNPLPLPWVLRGNPLSKPRE